MSWVTCQNICVTVWNTISSSHLAAPTPTKYLNMSGMVRSPRTSPRCIFHGTLEALPRCYHHARPTFFHLPSPQGTDAPADAHPLTLCREGTSVTNHWQMVPYPSKDHRRYPDEYKNLCACLEELFSWVETKVRSSNHSMRSTLLIFHRCALIYQTCSIKSKHTPPFSLGRRVRQHTRLAGLSSTSILPRQGIEMGWTFMPASLSRRVRINTANSCCMNQVWCYLYALVMA